MYLIVGLGNPEPDYEKTRHNMGFHVINQLAKEHEIEMTRNKFNAIFGTGNINGEKVMLVKPQTYMNASGESVIAYKNFYKLDISQIMIIYDDIDLAPGEIRIRKKGRPGTHNGIKSVVHFLSTEEFLRVRVGIGKPQEGTDIIDHVIGAVPQEEWELLESGIHKATKAVDEIFKSSIHKAMNLYN